MIDFFKRTFSRDTKNLQNRHSDITFLLLFMINQFLLSNQKLLMVINGILPH